MESQDKHRAVRHLQRAQELLATGQAENLQGFGGLFDWLRPAKKPATIEELQGELYNENDETLRVK